METLAHTGFTEFLAEHNGERLVDLLLMDVEGAEFGIVHKMAARLHEETVQKSEQNGLLKGLFFAVFSLKRVRIPKKISEIVKIPEPRNMFIA